MADQTTRSAARLATLVAVPLALVAGVIAFALLAGVLTAPAEPPDSPGGTPAPTAPGPVATEERDLTERETIVCRALLSQLPQTAADLPQRPVTAGAEQNAAYGDPPITLECGVPAAEFAPTDQVWPFEGVCYHGTEPPGGTAWVTVDREVPVRVTVPDDYGGQWVAEFSPTILATVPSADTDDIPSGCR